MSKRSSKINKCLTCGNEFHPYDSSDGLYCTNKCQARKRSKDAFESGKAGPKCARVNLFLLYGHICQVCKQTEWNGVPIPLVCDHIDGNSENNLPSNLRLICPNCDALLPTYKAKNKGNGRWKRMQRYKENKSY